MMAVDMRRFMMPRFWKRLSRMTHAKGRAC
jgi:hypothetical protein